MTDRGLYPTTAYFCVAIPIRPLSIEDLPQAIRVIVSRTVLKGVPLQAIPRIEYGSTLHY